ncbi:MAG: LacI family DNA-binding transcriptional regulator [Bacillota bacterium]|nr:LacI family DNA-binding transcriptional regulator [Bacillota bacterium]HHT91692.1 substrate-binding domain-containing protein [Bacillota bacterium]
MVTIREIARIAKVSRGTVDKVLNNRPGVSDEVRERVSGIAKALGYKPNIIGKALANQKKAFLIGVIVPPDSNPYFEDIKRGVNAAYDEVKYCGIQIDYQVMRSLEPKEQLGIIEHLVDKGITALALNPINDDMIRDAIDEMTGGGIPVVTFTSDILRSRRLCFVGLDVVKSGRVAGELMGKLLQGKGKVAVVFGSRSILSHNQRIEGFTAVMRQDYPGIEILEMVENLDRDDVSFEVTLSLLERYPDLDGLCLMSAGIGGAGRAIKLAENGYGIKVVSFDFIPETVELVKEGIIDFTIGQNPFMQGYQPIKILSDYLLFDRVPQVDFYRISNEIKIKQNIDELYV